jgi:60 kDa SS-A/Ro ribonucleoprotein
MTTMNSSPARALAEYAVKGTIDGTFYASIERQLDRVRELADEVSPALVAKAAVRCRAHGKATLVPAFLVAHLAARDVATMSRVFARVVDDGPTLRTFVELVRSGVTGRKSFGSAPKRALRAWFAARSPDAVFRESSAPLTPAGAHTGTRALARKQSPSMSDVIKMVRPPPRNDAGEPDAVREALYGYLIGKSVDSSALPPLARALEAFKKGAGPAPDVPFDLLATFPLKAQHWIALAKTMPVTELLAYLDALSRHGVLDDAATARSVAARLADADTIRHARVTPRALYAAHAAYPAPGARPSVTHAIADALREGLEHSVANLPSLEGRVVVCPDVSGSMSAPLGGKLRCLDVAALLSAAILRRNRGATVLPFADDVVTLDPPIASIDPILVDVERIAALHTGGTSCAAPLLWLASHALRTAGAEAPDVVVVLSDTRARADFPAMADAWEALRARNPNAKLVLVDLAPDPERAAASAASPAPAPPREDILYASGFSDALFDVIATFTREGHDGEACLRSLEAIEI